MSLAKRKLEEKQAYHNMAFEVLEEVKAIEFCLCRRIYRLGSNRDHAYEYGTAEAKREFQGKETDFKLLRKEIEQVLKEAAPDDAKCDYCEA